MRAIVVSTLLLAGTGASAQNGGWVQVDVAGPSPRFSPMFAFDSARGVAVLFGGLTGNGASGETWEWDGVSWVRRDIPGPEPRYNGAMAFDPVRNVMVLHGGASNMGVYEQTWEYDGVAWTMRTTSGPGVRYNHDMVFDTARGVAVFFGGATACGQLRNDTWEWDGTAWSLRSTAGPAPRWTHAMTFDNVAEKTVLIHGDTDTSCDTHSITGDSWEWNGTQWSQTPNPLPPRISHAAAFNSADGELLVFGGSCGPWLSDACLYSDTWLRRNGHWTKYAGAAPSARRTQHAICYDSVRNQFVLFGGHLHDNVELGDTWVFTTPSPSCEADFDGDGFVTGTDFDLFVQAFEAGDDAADFDEDGFITGLDFDLYVQAFEAGC